MVHGCPLSCVMYLHCWKGGKGTYGGQMEYWMGLQLHSDDHKIGGTVQ